MSPRFIIPIPPGYKHPFGIDRWQEKATIDVQRITKYWTLNPDHGIGIATGAESGLWVLDIDPDDGGDDSLAALEARHGALPDTVEAITGGGGRHLVFAWPADGTEIRILGNGDSPWHVEGSAALGYQLIDDRSGQTISIEFEPLRPWLTLQ